MQSLKSTDTRRNSEQQIAVTPYVLNSPDEFAERAKFYATLPKVDGEFVMSTAELCDHMRELRLSITTLLTAPAHLKAAARERVDATRRPLLLASLRQARFVLWVIEGSRPWKGKSRQFRHLSTDDLWSAAIEGINSATLAPPMQTRSWHSCLFDRIAKAVRRANKAAAIKAAKGGAA